MKKRSAVVSLGGVVSENLVIYNTIFLPPSYTNTLPLLYNITPLLSPRTKAPITQYYRLLQIVSPEPNHPNPKKSQGYSLPQNCASTFYTNTALFINVSPFCCTTIGRCFPHTGAFFNDNTGFRSPHITDP